MERASSQIAVGPAPAHSARAHALLSPSASGRWLKCTPSVRFCEHIPARTSDSAKEGTTAHEIAEMTLRARWAGLATLAEHPEGNMEMLTHAEGYADYILDTAAKMAGAPELGVEKRVEVGSYAPECYGTVDAYLYSREGGELHVIDYKYGRGVKVDALRNTQMRVYALGLVDEIEFFGDAVRVISMTIYQPRLDNVTTDTISVEELKRWAETELTPRARMAYNGEGDYVPGGHCVFCPGRPECRTLAAHALGVTGSLLRDANRMTPGDLGEVLRRVEVLNGYADALRAHALERAMAGEPPTGYKVVEGRSVRTYADEDAVAAALTAEGLSAEMIYERKLIGVARAEKLLGKKRFGDVLGALIVKPQGKPTLVPEEDKRAAITSAAAFEGL